MTGVTKQLASDKTWFVVWGLTTEGCALQLYLCTTGRVTLLPVLVLGGVILAMTLAAYTWINSSTDSQTLYTRLRKSFQIMVVFNILFQLANAVLAFVYVGTTAGAIQFVIIIAWALLWAYREHQDELLRRSISYEGNVSLLLV